MTLRERILGKDLYAVYVARNENAYATVLVSAATKRQAGKRALARRPRDGRGTFRQQGYRVVQVVEA